MEGILQMVDMRDLIADAHRLAFEHLDLRHGAKTMRMQIYLDVLRTQDRAADRRIEHGNDQIASDADHHSAGDLMDVIDGIGRRYRQFCFFDDIEHSIIERHTGNLIIIPGQRVQHGLRIFRILRCRIYAEQIGRFDAFDAEGRRNAGHLKILADGADHQIALDDSQKRAAQPVGRFFVISKVRIAVVFLDDRKSHLAFIDRAVIQHCAADEDHAAEGDQQDEGLPCLMNDMERFLDPFDQIDLICVLHLLPSFFCHSHIHNDRNDNRIGRSSPFSTRSAASGSRHSQISAHAPASAFPASQRRP